MKKSHKVKVNLFRIKRDAGNTEKDDGFKYESTGNANLSLCVT